MSGICFNKMYLAWYLSFTSPCLYQNLATSFSSLSLNELSSLTVEAGSPLGQVLLTVLRNLGHLRVHSHSLIHHSIPVPSIVPSTETAQGHFMLSLLPGISG